MRKSTTKNALLMSALSLFLCFAMLTGTTFAWFTDTVESGVNQIVAGNLDVELYHSDKAANKEAVTTGTKLFDDVDSTKWEPGAMAYEVFTVENKGNLALKYELTLNAINPTIVDNVSFASMLKVAVIEDETFVYTRENIANITTWNSLATFTLPGTLEAKAEGATANPSKTYGIVIWWQPSDLDNLFNMNNGQTVGSVKVDVGVKLVATQLMAESDSFGPDYDEDSQYPALGSANIPANSTNPTTIEAGNVDVTIPAGVPAGNYSLQVSPATTSTDASGKTTVSMDINLNRDGVKVVADGTLYTVSVELGKNLEVTAVTHNGNNVASFNYDPATGIVTFTTESFSPFAFTYTEADDESVFVPADPDAAEKLDPDYVPEEGEKEVVAVDENGNEYTNITEAVKSGASKLYFKEGADLGTITHLDVANDLVIYGNGAYISGGERDLAIDQYVLLTKDITVTVYNLHGIAFWGTRQTTYTANLNLYNCNNISRVYMNGTTGVTNVALYNCTASTGNAEAYKNIVGDTAVYSNANGSVTVDGCTFTNIGCPVNLNHKIAGEQKVTVTNTTFVDCATEGTAAYYAPIRLYNSVEGANQTLTVKGNTFTYSEGKAPINKADVLLNAKHNGVDAAGTIKATVQAGADVVCGVNVDVTFEINTAEELFAFAADVNKYSNYERPFDGQTVKLMNDIDLGGAEWTPIGDYRFSANRFCGTFDGQGHTISNFKITKKTDKNDSNKSSYGFFGNMEGTVKNLTIDKANVCSYAYVGALIGRLNSGTVENCHVTNSAVETTYWQAGGMIGQLNEACTVKDCTITNTTVTGASAIGGMFGPLTATGSDKTLLFENNTVKDCTVVQNGSFGADYDVFFGAMFCDIDVADNKTDINKCKVENTTVKDVVSNALFGSLSGTKVLFDGYEFVSDGLYKQKVKYRVYNAEGLAALNTMMVNKTAGKAISVELMADIDFAGKTWTPVDSHADTAFEIAEINGNGHIIYNLTINGQAMFTRFAGSGDVVVKDITFDGATVSSTGINVSVLTVQTYQNVLLDNVDVKNSTFTGAYKVAPLIGSVYNESSSTITATLKNCDVSNTTVTCTSYDFCTAGMVAFVYEGNNDKVVFENCTVSDVKLYAKPNGYASHAWVYVNDADTDDCFNDVEGVTVTNCTFEALQ